MSGGEDDKHDPLTRSAIAARNNRPRRAPASVVLMLFLLLAVFSDVCIRIHDSHSDGSSQLASFAAQTTYSFIE